MKSKEADRAMGIMTDAIEHLEGRLEDCESELAEALRKIEKLQDRIDELEQQ